MIRIHGAACIIWAVMLLLIPLPWLASLLTAALVHEIGHIAAVYLVGATVEKIDLEPGGAVIHASTIEPWKGIVCSLAGPITGSLLIMMYKVSPRLALCAAVQTAYNLLPVEPLDGGRALSGLQILLFGRKVEWIDHILTLLLITGMLVISAVLRIPCILMCAIPLLREKFLANTQNKGYNSAAKEK